MRIINGCCVSLEDIGGEGTGELREKLFDRKEQWVQASEVRTGEALGSLHANGNFQFMCYNEEVISDALQPIDRDIRGAYNRCGIRSIEAFIQGSLGSDADGGSLQYYDTSSISTKQLITLMLEGMYCDRYGRYWQALDQAMLKLLAERCQVLPKTLGEESYGDVFEPMRNLFSEINFDNMQVATPIICGIIHLYYRYKGCPISSRAVTQLVELGLIVKVYSEHAEHVPSAGISSSLIHSYLKKLRELYKWRVENKLNKEQFQEGLKQVVMEGIHSSGLTSGAVKGVLEQFMREVSRGGLTGEYILQETLEVLGCIISLDSQLQAMGSYSMAHNIATLEDMLFQEGIRQSTGNHSEGQGTLDLARALLGEDMMQSTTNYGTAQNQNVLDPGSRPLAESIAQPTRNYIAGQNSLGFDPVTQGGAAGQFMEDDSEDQSILGLVEIEDKLLTISGHQLILPIYNGYKVDEVYQLIGTANSLPGINTSEELIMKIVELQVGVGDKPTRVLRSIDVLRGDALTLYSQQDPNFVDVDLRKSVMGMLHNISQKKNPDFTIGLLVYDAWKALNPRPPTKKHQHMKCLLEFYNLCVIQRNKVIDAQMICNFSYVDGMLMCGDGTPVEPPAQHAAYMEPTVSGYQVPSRTTTYTGQEFRQPEGVPAFSQYPTSPDTRQFSKTSCSRGCCGGPWECQGKDI